MAQRQAWCERLQSTTSQRLNCRPTTINTKNLRCKYINHKRRNWPNSQAESFLLITTFCGGTLRIHCVEARLYTSASCIDMRHHIIETFAFTFLVRLSVDCHARFSSVRLCNGRYFMQRACNARGSLPQLLVFPPLVMTILHLRF